MFGRHVGFQGRFSLNVRSGEINRDLYVAHWDTDGRVDLGKRQVMVPTEVKKTGDTKTQVAKGMAFWKFQRTFGYTNIHQHFIGATFLFFHPGLRFWDTAGPMALAMPWIGAPVSLAELVYCISSLTMLN